MIALTSKQGGKHGWVNHIELIGASFVNHIHTDIQSTQKLHP